MQRPDLKIQKQFGFFFRFGKKLLQKYKNYDIIYAERLATQVFAGSAAPRFARTGILTASQK